VLRRLFRNTEELEKLSELGVLFLLFEMGLELSLDRLKVHAGDYDISALLFALSLLAEIPG
jgi:Kef-type K+ transport system membrane component KefB